MFSLNLSPLYKYSKTWTCLCGYVHVVQGPCSCWVCQERFDFIPPSIQKQVYRDLQAMRWSQENLCKWDTKRSLDRNPREQGWPEEAGLGKLGRLGFGGMEDDRNVNKRMTARRF